MCGLGQFFFSFFLACGGLIASTVCWRGYLSSTKLILYLCEKSFEHICVGLFLGFSVQFSVYQYHTLDNCVVQWALTSGRRIPPTFFLSYQDYLPVLGPVAFHINFSINLHTFCRKSSGISIGIALRVFIS